MTTQSGNKTDLEINGMETQSSLPAKVDELKDMEPIAREVMNQKTGEFERVMISPEDIRTYLAPLATLPELYIFMSICRHQNIDPVSEAYFVKYQGQPGFTVMKYTVYLKRALKSGLIKSIKHEFDDEENPTKITVHLERTDIAGEWTWTTYRREVEQTRKSDGKVTAIWQKQPRFMMVKCAYSQALRFFCADVVGALPPVEEEMGGIPALDMPRPMLDTDFAAEPLEVKDVKPLPEHIDMGGFRDTYFGTLKDLGMSFTTDEARRHFQKQDLKIKGNGSIKNLSVAEWADVFEKLADMKAELKQAAAGNDDSVFSATQAEEEQEDPQESGAIEQQIQEKIDKLEAENTPNPAEMKGVELEEFERKQSEGEKPESAERTFYTEANKRFKSIVAMSEWCKWIVSEKPYDKWTAEQFQIALPLLMEVPLLGKTQEGQDNAKESTQQPDNKSMAKDTLNKIRDMLADFPDKKYKTMKSVAFREFASKAAGREETIPTLTNCNEAEAQKILAALAEEQSAILYANLGDGEPVVVDEVVAGEIIDGNPLDDPDVAFDLMVTYLEKAELRFANKDARQAWESENNLPPVPPSVWKADELKNGISLLEGVTPMADIPDDNPELMTQEQFDNISGAAKILPYKNVGSIAFRDRVSEILKAPYQPIRGLSVEKASDLVLAFEDEIQDFENKRGRYTPTVV